MKPGQKIFDTTTRGGWFEAPLLKDTLLAAGLPKTAVAAQAQSSSSAGFSSTGWLGSSHRRRSRGRVGSLVLRPPATAKRSSLTVAT